MGEIWSEENKFKTWLDVELAACSAWNKLGRIPNKALSLIQKKAKFNIKRIDRIEQKVNHDVIAFLTSVAENVGPASRYIHLGLTSSDVVDTALSLQLRQAVALITGDIEKLLKVLRRRARQYKDTIMMGRTHGIHAEPTTFGLKLALWYSEMQRNLRRILSVQKIISVGQISGAVGTYANVDPRVEILVCRDLKLEADPISSQIIQRDRHAELLTTLAVVGASLEKFATEIRHLQRTEVWEVEEPFAKGQKGSSAMPHKKNPIICERICGLARILRGNAVVGLENVALWHERDISHSSAERVILPDSFIILDYILNQFIKIMDGMVVYPEHMRANLNRSGGIVFSQRLLLAIVDKGLSREDAYALVQSIAMEARQRGIPFYQLASANARVKSLIKSAELSRVFDPQHFIRHVDRIFTRLGI